MISFNSSRGGCSLEPTNSSGPTCAVATMKNPRPGDREAWDRGVQPYHRRAPTRGIAEVRGRLSADAQADFNRFLTSPFSVPERSQCRIREDLLRLTVLWHDQLHANIVDKDPELRQGLDAIADTLLDFLRYDRTSISIR